MLFCATVDYHFKAFHLPYLKWFKEQGWEVHVAAKGNIELPFVDKKFNLPIHRSPFKLQNLKAYQELKTIIQENKYSIIHCHTPMGGVLARLASRATRRKGTKVIYTAHGFHFCKGAPLLNWMVYYPIERGLAQYTDCLITINEEDYRLAIDHGFKAQKVERVHGVGVDTEKYKPVSDECKRELRMQYGYQHNDFMMFYAAEFNKNKNQKFLIHSLAIIKEEIPYAKLLLAGEGPLMEACKELALKLGVEDMVDFLGYRNDLDSILPMCDIAVASSLREGLPVNIMEAMACGLPVIAVDNRGHRELVHNGQSGWLVEYPDMANLVRRIRELAANKKLVARLGATGRKNIEKKYSMHKVLSEGSRIYLTFEEEMEGVRWAIQ